jgi:RNA-binding protein YlmH
MENLDYVSAVRTLAERSGITIPENATNTSGRQEVTRSRVLEMNKEAAKYFRNALFDSKYGAIGHRNVLGTIMSLGIERNTFGDIVVEDNLITIFVSKEISEYLIKNLSMISHQRMNWEIISSFKQSNIKEEVKTINVASMRLDAVVAKSINVGRSEAVEIINSGNVLINHKQCLNITHNVKEQDILSIRKFGRIEILEIVGLSKKNRTIVEIRVKH